MYHVQTQQFSGPLEKLLELIEAKKLDITTISLAAVTADFIAYVDTLKRSVADSSADPDTLVSTRALSDFLVVAAQLVLIKSKELLPDVSFTQDEQEQMIDLERRLKLYSALKPLFVNTRLAWQNASPSFSREFFKDVPVIFYPPASLALNQLSESLGNLLQSLGSLVIDHEQVERQLISLEEKIQEVSEKIMTGVSRFSHMAAQSREELIVLFLALLHLLRDQTIRVTQQELFGEIEMEKVEHTKSG